MIAVDLGRIAAEEQTQPPPAQIRCCTAAGCLAVGSLGVVQRLQQTVQEKGLQQEVRISPVGCLRLCSQGPLVSLEPSGQMYQKVTSAQAPSLLDAVKGGTTTATPLDPKLPYFTKQFPLVTENCGKVEPERLSSSIAAGAYQMLAQALHEMKPAQIVDAVTRSGLRGRGGAGYPTGLKWALVAKTPSPQKYVVCNADEGDPGAFKDRTLLESDPHRILEGMAIAGYAVGANQGYIYIRGEYTLAIERLQIALHQARQAGLLGSHLFGTQFDFTINLRMGAGAYVCGEETALIASIEGGRGTPRPRPPYPGESGLWGHPTLLNNVETFATIAPLLRRGADWYASLGMNKSKGTKVFSLSGKVKYNGLVEVPMGTTLRTIVEEIGGGAPEGHRLKAVQTGGPSGGAIPADLLDTPIDYEAMAALGSIIGSGGMVVMDDSVSMVDVATFFMDFCREESCGKCIPCRAGTVQMHHLLSRIGQGQGTRADLHQLETLADMVKHTSLCGLGQAAPNPVQSTLRFFRKEYEEKLK